MNTNGDYLWDKTGEPDPEVQQLEEILGTLRYQPRPLELPADLKTDPKQTFFAGLSPRLAPNLAIAATILIVLLGLGLWLGLRRLQRNEPQELVKDQSIPSLGPVPSPIHSPDKTPNEVVKLPDSSQKHSDGSRRHGSNDSLLAVHTNRGRNQPRKEAVKDPQLAENELQEGKAAKDQLMLALRVASAKLNFAQRKTQITNPREPVHNQHKIG